MANEICCPNCGNRELQVQTETNVESTGKDYSSAKGCLGYMAFGPLGLLCGNCGQNKKISTTNTTYWTCPKCGKRFRTPDDIRKDIEENKKTFMGQVIMVVIVIIVAVFALNVSIHDVFIAVVTGIIMLPLCIGVLYYISSSKNKKIEAEAQQLEADMQRFLK